MNLNNTIVADRSLESQLDIIQESAKQGSPVILLGANPDKFAEISWQLKQQGFHCVGQTDQPLTHQFVALSEGKQRILVHATNDNLHFMQPVMRLMREQGHHVTELSQLNLTENSLLAAMQHCDTAWFEWGDSAVISASKLPKYCRIVCRIHRYELYGDHFLQADWNNIDEVILVSQAMKKRFISLLGSNLPPHLKVTVLANLCDHQPLKQTTKKRNPFYLACVARFAAQKNLILLLPIMQALVKKDARYKLFIAGRVEDQCLYDSFCHLIDVYGLSRNIVICGNLPSSNMPDWYADKSFILSASYNESQGMGIFEAMMAGLKPIAFHAHGGLSEYLPGEYLFTSIGDAVTRVLEGNLSPESYILEAQTLLQQQALVEQYPAIWRPDIISSSLISILIPCYNRERYLLTAVSSALNQRDANFEVIVVDDGSSDNSVASLAHIDDSRLHIICKPHSNAPDTRNRCIAEARGEFLVWLDSDDILHSNALSHYRTLLQRWPQVDVISCGLESLDGEKKYYSIFNHPPQNWLTQLPHGNFISNPGCCVRRSIYTQVGGYDINYPRAHDYEFWSRAAGCAKIAFTAQCNINYRLHESNLTGIGKLSDTTYEYRIFESILKRYRYESLFTGLKRKDIEGFVADRRATLYSATDLDSITVVLNAIGASDQNLIKQAQWLRMQEDKRFNIIFVSDKKLPFSSLPVLIMDSFSPEEIRNYVRENSQDIYHRFFVLANDATSDATSIAALKTAILNDVDIPDNFYPLAI
ncbi:glycosyltransferase [Pantoea sp. SOD02]|uniref:glycosyltransferase n=1 Tax=Pantoea sp. SOD02 TaxID=2970818 RepID=UPI0021588B16|nr:glycosyltransferase [Pantoea sp. SOD02]UVC31524.1 glycosyltransferase [Pantoea sp. SOD02]